MDLMRTAYFGVGSGQADLPIIVLGIALAAFWVAMLVDAIRRDYSDSSMRIVWVMVILFMQLLGALVYFLFGRSTGTRK
jgi:heme/copper-type cytochrome/quinol oxidase subunit 4